MTQQDKQNKPINPRSANLVEITKLLYEQQDNAILAGSPFIKELKQKVKLDESS